MNGFLSTQQQQTLNTLELSYDAMACWAVNYTQSVDTYYSIIDWARYPISIERVLLVQRVLLQLWRPAVLDGLTTISRNDRYHAENILRLFAIIDHEYPGRTLSDLSKDDWEQLVIASLFHSFDKEGDRDCQLIKLKQPQSKIQLSRIITIINSLHQYYVDGDIHDGPEYSITKTSINQTLRSVLASLNIDLADWEKGGSYGSIPFVIAHLLLADALEILSSPRTQQLLTYFATVRDQEAQDLVKTFWNDHRTTLLYRYRHTGDTRFLKATKKGDERSRLLNRCKMELGLPLHHRLTALQSDESQFTFPWPMYNKLLQDYTSLRTAIYIIFLSVMGKRGPSEVNTLRGVDITLPDYTSGQDALMRPAVSKTHKGLRQEQGVTNYIDEAIGVILKLSYWDKSDTELPLFSALPGMAKTRIEPRRLSTQQASWSLRKYYNAFCDRVACKVDFDVSEIHPKVTSHQFRHSFAEFALRRYDGNVEELFRQHALHSHNHWWTKRYTADKLDNDRKNKINRNYIRELVPRVLRDSDNNPDFVGAMALYIKKTLSDKIAVIAPEEAEARIEEFCDHIIQITPHEYGWCLLHQAYLHAAQCQDSNGKPNPASTSCEKCSICGNFVASRQSHLATHTKIVITHTNFLEQDTFKMPSLKLASMTAIEKSTQIFPELKEMVDL